MHPELSARQSRRRPTVTGIEAEAEALLKERDSAIAKQLVDNLWVARDAKGSVTREILAATTESHPVPDVRELARALLAQQSESKEHGK